MDTNNLPKRMRAGLLGGVSQEYWTDVETEAMIATRYADLFYEYSIGELSDFLGALCEGAGGSYGALYEEFQNVPHDKLARALKLHRWERETVWGSI